MSSAFPPALSRSLISAAIPTIVTGGVVWRALSTNAWSQWGIEAMAPMTTSATSFADLANITATAQCINDGTDYTVCDPYGRPFQPYVVLPARVLAVLGLGPDHTGLLGTLLAVLYVLTIAALAWFLARSWRAGFITLVGAQVLLALLAISPPAMLAIERGQIEILGLTLTIAALLALSHKRVGVGVAGAAAAVAAVVVKFFAIGLFAPFIRRGRPNWPALIGLAASVAFLVFSWSDLMQASSAARADQPATSKSQFGAATLVATILTPDPVGYLPSVEVADNWAQVRLAGWIIVALAVVIAAVVVPRTSLLTIDRLPAARALVIGGAGVLALPYVLGASHDYRMIFLLPVVVGALVWMSASGGPGSWLPVLIVVAAVVSIVTGAAMVTTPSGFMWSKTAMVAGDIGLLITLAACGGVWVRGLVKSS